MRSGGSKTRAISLTIIFLLIASLAAADVDGELRVGKDLLEDSAFVNILIGYDFDVLKLNIRFYGSWMTWFHIEWERPLGQAPFRDIYGGRYDAQLWGLLRRPEPLVLTSSKIQLFEQELRHELAGLADYGVGGDSVVGT